jgi:hypothetical protein
MNDYEVFDLGDVVLREGATLRGAKLAYKTYGALNDEKSNAIVYPTRYSGRHWENEWLTGEGMALDPNEYFIIVPNMLGNGLSSSPSNTPPHTTKPASPASRSKTTSPCSTSLSPSVSASRGSRLSPGGRWAQAKRTSGPSATRRCSRASSRFVARPRPACTT